MIDYPAPNAPMVGSYLARKRTTALAFSVIDKVCALARTQPSFATDNPTSILVSQGGHLGDLIMTLPMLHWLRINRKNARIGLLVGSWSKPMMASISELYDNVYYADHFLLNRSSATKIEKIATHYRTWRKARAEIQRDGYDVAFEAFQFFPNNIPLLRWSGIQARVGYTSGSWSNLLTHPVAWAHAKRHFTDYPRDLLRTVFDDPSLEQPFAAYYPLPKATGPLSGEYVVVHMGTGNNIREWDEDHWCELVKRLLGMGEKIVLAGAGSVEAQRSARIAEANEGAVDLTNKLSWDEFVALIAHAKHTICLESSSAHLSASFARPTTTIMPAINMPEQLGPAGPLSTYVTRPTPCAPCYRTNGCEGMWCIRDVTPQNVISAFLRENRQNKLTAQLK